MSDRIAINSSYVEQIASLIEVNNFTELNLIIADLHIADIAEIIEDLSIENAHFLFNLIEEERSASVLVELEDDTREEILSDLTAKEIADGVIDNLESDDAADVIGELSENKKEEVLALIEDIERASDISDLLTYEDDTAGGLMAKELVQVKSSISNVRPRNPDYGEEAKQNANHQCEISHLHETFARNKDDKNFSRKETS